MASRRGLPTPQPLDAADPPPYAGSADARGGLRARAARGTIINAAFLVGLQTLGLLKGFVVATFMTAAQFGVWGILVIALGTLGKLKQVGIGDKFIQQNEADQELAFQKAFTLELLSHGALLAVVTVAIPLYAAIYGQSEIVLPGYVLAVSGPALALQTPTWVFYRQMQYLRQRTLQAVQPVVATIATIPLAIAGLGYWSLVLGLVIGRCAGAFVAVRAAPYRLRFRYDRETMREYMRFSWPLFAASVSVFLIPQISMLVGEWKLGLAGAGVIALAGSVIIYTDRVGAVVTQALYPAICRVRDRVDLLYESFVKSNRLALMWAVPFGVGLTLFAPDLIEFVLGERWRPAVPLLQVWGIAAAVNHIGFNWSAYYRAQGRTRPVAIVSALGVATLAVTIVPLVSWQGIEGFGMAVGAMTVVFLLSRGYFLAKLFPSFRLLGHVLRGFAPTVPAVAVTLAIRGALETDRTLGVAIGELAIYLAVTVAATALAEQALLREAIGYVRRSRRPARPVPAG